MKEVLGAIKAEIAGRIPVGIRLCGAEILDDRGGNTLDESIESFRIAEEAGADYRKRHRRLARVVYIGHHQGRPMGHWLWVAERVKKAVTVPVMMAFPPFPARYSGKGDRRCGSIDFWEACRPMIADPALP